MSFRRYVDSSKSEVVFAFHTLHYLRDIIILKIDGAIFISAFAYYSISQSQRSIHGNYKIPFCGAYNSSAKEKWSSLRV